MSTRGLYTFIDDSDDKFTVFKHWDNYPSGAYDFIQKALSLAWDLPRFEADEFGASFIAANKKAGGGDLRLTNSETTNGDVLGVEYHYFISPCPDAKDCIRVFTYDLYHAKHLPVVYISKDSISTHLPALVEKEAEYAC
jgi:hypothetical protein